VTSPNLELELELETRFQREIVAGEFAECPPQDEPVAVIVVDLPGADADRRVRQIAEHLTRQGGRPVILTDQVLESYDPRTIASTLRGQDPPPEVTEATRWMGRRSDHWIQAYGVNVIIKVPADRAAEVLTRASAYRAAGHRTAVSLPVASHPVRWWGQVERHVAGLAARLAAALTPPTLSIQDAHTRGLTSIARSLDQGAADVDDVEVVRPGRGVFRLSGTSVTAVLRAPGDRARGSITRAVQRELRGPVIERVARLINRRLPKLHATVTRLFAGRDSTGLAAVRDRIDQVAQALLATAPRAIGRAAVAAVTRPIHRQPPRASDPERGA
jgi:hypothetical protein